MSDVPRPCFNRLSPGSLFERRECSANATTGHHRRKRLIAASLVASGCLGWLIHDVDK